MIMGMLLSIKWFWHFYSNVIVMLFFIKWFWGIILNHDHSDVILGQMIIVILF